MCWCIIVEKTEETTEWAQRERLIELRAWCVASVIEWFVCSITVQEGVVLIPARTKVVIPVFTLPRSQQGFVRNHWYKLASYDHHMRMWCWLCSEGKVLVGCAMKADPHRLRPLKGWSLGNNAPLYSTLSRPIRPKKCCINADIIIIIIYNYIIGTIESCTMTRSISVVFTEQSCC